MASLLVPATAAAWPVSLAVLDRDDGQWLSPTRHRGEHWIAGTPGHRYGVQLTNTSDRRVLVVLSIDGVNAISGDTAHPSQAGYVLAPGQSTRIDGWRKSMQDVAGFHFTRLGDSYAARTGRPDHVGVIGIAVFAEARRTPVYPAPPPIAHPQADAGAARESRRGAIAAESSVAAPAATQRIGTGHGEREYAPTRHARFVRASRQPTQLLQWRYDAPEALMARGIVPHWKWRGPRHDRPQAFPTGFVPDPSN
ncbi:hypothetical protein [Lysobacter sp. A3-1-A15]|uniref:hypothetical protein n=1 Tax=Novilysobacter viscosus TaxID=3098602 RepID=UPI002EDBA804